MEESKDLEDEPCSKKSRQDESLDQSSLENTNILENQEEHNSEKNQDDVGNEIDLNGATDLEHLEQPATHEETIIQDINCENKNQVILEANSETLLNDSKNELSEEHTEDENMIQNENASKVPDIFEDGQGLYNEQSEEQESIANTEIEKVGYEAEYIDEAHPEVDYSYEKSYFASENITELASYSWNCSADNQQYTKGCLWSPDGTCCLVGVNGDGMHLMELPHDLYGIEKLDKSRAVSELKSAVHVPEAGMVYDFCWYPFMNSSSPDTCLWISTRQHEPIHMWDAFDGTRRASYLGYDDADEVQAAIVVAFTDDGEKILGGYKKSIKIFDTALPGRICTNIKIKQAASAFALTPTNPDLITTGTWSGTINLYDMRMPKNGCMSSLFGHKAGVTLIKYNYDATVLYSGSRKENCLLIWDMRNFSEPMKTLERNVQTNQRIFFDVSPGGYWLASGDTDGLLRSWTTENDYEEKKFPLYEDCCNGISFHPSRPIVSSSSGQFKFHNLNEDNESKENEFPTNFQNTLKFWWIGEVENKVD